MSDDEWAFAAPYLTLMREDAPQRRHDLRELFNGLRYVARTGCQWRYLPGDLPPWEAVYQQARRWMAARRLLRHGGRPAGRCCGCCSCCRTARCGRRRR